MYPSTKLAFVATFAAILAAGQAGAQSLVFDAPTYEDVASLKMSTTEDDSARIKAIRQAAMSIGASGGFLEKAKSIYSRYCLVPDVVACDEVAVEKARSLDGIFMFRPLVDQKGYLPPVVTEVSDSANVTENKMVVSGKVYRIAKPARFVLGVMTWRDYLMVGMDLVPIEPLPSALTPKNGREKAEWADAVKQGWEIGISRASAVFESNVDRLKSDYLGMLRYRRLRVLGLVNEPVIARDVRADVVTGNEHASGVETSEIMTPAMMEQNPDAWKAGLNFMDSSKRKK